MTIDSVTFSLQEKSIKEINFTCKCAFCGQLSQKLKTQFCDYCYKILSYSKQNDVIFYNFANFFRQIARNKNNFIWSWFDFECLEKEIWELCEENPATHYCKHKLGIYIDLGFCNVLHESSSEELAKLLDRICDSICKNLFINCKKYIPCDTYHFNLIQEFLEQGNKNNVVNFGNIHEVNISVIYNRHDLKKELLDGISFIY